MRVRCMTTLLVVVALMARDATATARCDGPYKTLSSDCRGLAVNANNVCIVLDQRAGQASPCTTIAASIHPTECAPAVRANQPCDVLMYRIDYRNTMARFRVLFPTDAATPTTARVLEEDPNEKRILRPLIGGRGPPVTPDTHVDYEPSSAPTTAPPIVRPPATPPPNQPPPPAAPVSPPAAPASPPAAPASPPAAPASPPAAPASPASPPTAPASPPAAPASPPAAGNTQPSSPSVGTVSVSPSTAASVNGIPMNTPKAPSSVSGSPATGPAGSPANSPTTSTTAPQAGASSATTTPQDGNSPASSTASPTVTQEPLDDLAETNDFVNAIGQLKLDPGVMELRIVGGSNEFGTRGKTVQLTIDLQFLSQSPHITALSIVNCNISSQLLTGGLVSGMPQNLTSLNLGNTLMQTEPIDVSALQNLRTLQMGQNYFTTLTKKMSLSKLTMLDASENSLTSFEPTLPVLESLYLNKNKFSEIPRIIYSMSKLQELQMTENPIVAIVVSTTQYEFLGKLRLKLDKPPSTPPTPVIYTSKNDVSKNTGRIFAAEILGLNLSAPNTDISNVVTKPVGSLVDLQGVSVVWKLSDEEYEVFQAQQDVIASSDVVINGTKVQSYLALAAAGAAAAVKTPISSSTTPDGQKPVSSNQSSSGKSHKTLISFVIIAVVAVIASIAVFVTRGRRRSNSSDDSKELTFTSPRDQQSTVSYQTTSNSNVNTQSSVESSDSLRELADHSIRNVLSSRRVRVADIEDVEPIGSGSTGIVWLVKHRGSRLLASKRLIQNSPATQRLTEFMNEIVIAARLDHPRIIHLIGVAWTNQTDLQALYDYMPHGDLQTHLHSTSPASLEWRMSKISTAIDIIEALVYTHSFNPSLLHRDLRTRNVLLDEKRHPQLGNFRNARYASEQNTMTTDGIGSGRWLAPEIVLGNTDYNAASDIYAFGVLLCELDTHQMPYEDVRDANGRNLVETAIIELVARGELRPTLSLSCPVEIREIMTRCLFQDPQDRPTSMQVAYDLRLLMRAWS